MATARAYCTCKKCGKEFEKITVKSNRREADSWEKWAVEYYDECEDCYKKRIKEQREEASKEAAESAKEIGLPALAGSEKQIAWAETIRMEALENLQTKIDHEKSMSGRERHAKLYDELLKFQEWILAKREAKFWIGIRAHTNDGASLWIALRTEFRSEYIPDDIKDEMIEKPEPTTAIVEPEEKRSETVCTVECTPEKVSVTSKYDADMVKVMRKTRFKWSGKAWEREIGVTTGAAEDRAAEIANKLLVAGFPVKIDKAIMDKAVSGTYEPEHERWIVKSNGVLKVYGDVQPKGIPGAKGRMVPVESWESIEEFARLHDFRFSPEAQEMLEEYKSRITKAVPIEGAKAEYNDTSAEIKRILDSSRDVLDDLREDE